MTLMSTDHTSPHGKNYNKPGGAGYGKIRSAVVTNEDMMNNGVNLMKNPRNHIPPSTDMGMSRRTPIGTAGKATKKPVGPFNKAL